MVISALTKEKRKDGGNREWFRLRERRRKEKEKEKEKENMRYALGARMISALERKKRNEKCLLNFLVMVK